MKTLILFACLLLLQPSLQAAQNFPINVLVNTNGTLRFPTNLFVANSNLLNAAVAASAAVFTTGAGVTNISGVVSANLTNGANITLTTNANGVISIASSDGSFTTNFASLTISNNINRLVLSTSGATVNLDVDGKGEIEQTISANTLFTFTNTPGSGFSRPFLLRLTGDGTSTVTLGATGGTIEPLSNDFTDNGSTVTHTPGNGLVVEYTITFRGTTGYAGVCCPPIAISQITDLQVTLDDKLVAAEIDTLAELNALIGDADVPALAGQLGGTAASPDVRGIRETAGPTLLTIGAIADGEFLKRSGSTVVGGTAGGGSAPVGTVVNSGSTTNGVIPQYKDATGTNVGPTSLVVNGADRQLTFTSQSSDNATNVALVVDTAVPWTDGMLTSVRNGGSEFFSISAFKGGMAYFNNTAMGSGGDVLAASATYAASDYSGNPATLYAEWHSGVSNTNQGIAAVGYFFMQPSRTNIMSPLDFSVFSTPATDYGVLAVHESGSEFATGVYGAANHPTADYGFGVVGVATRKDVASVGVSGVAEVNTPGSSIVIGGFFQTYDLSNAPPTMESAVLLLDNRDTGLNLIKARANGVNRFIVDQQGSPAILGDTYAEVYGEVGGVPVFDLFGDASDVYLHLDAAGNRVVSLDPTSSASSVAYALNSSVTHTSGDFLTIKNNSTTLVTLSPAGNGVFAGSVTIGDNEAYDATGWNGDLSVPTKDAVRDKIETLGGGGTVGTVINTGASVATAVPTYSDTTGTNIIPSSVTIAALTNLSAGNLNITGNGALSDPAVHATGTWITGGSATTTKPYWLIEPTGSTSANWSTFGTGLGVNAPSGFSSAGILIDAQLNGASRFTVSGSGQVTSSLAAGNAAFKIQNGVGSSIFWNGAGQIKFTADGKMLVANDGGTGLTWLQLGPDAATPSSSVQLRGPGGSGIDKNAGDLKSTGGVATGTGRGGALHGTTSLTTTTGSTAQSESTRFYHSAKFVDLTESTATLFANIALASSKYMGVRLNCTVNAGDGTDFQAVNSNASFSAVNKAGTVTVGTVTQNDDGTAASTGTLTVTYTAVANGNGVDIKANAVSSLTQTTLRVKWSILSLNSDDVGTVTVQ